MTSPGERVPRERFTKVLISICRRLDEGPRIVEWEQRYVLPLRQRTQVSPRSLWVFGSYERGAPECGDLDLILDVEKKCLTEPDPSFPHILNLMPFKPQTTALIGRLANVRCHIGTPERNTSGLAHEDVRLIWAADGLDWCQAIRAIQIDPEATHFARPTDRFPLRPEQFSYAGENEDLLAAESDGLIQWEFIPLGEPDVEALESAEGAKMVAGSRGVGRETAKLLPHILSYMRNRFRIVDSGMGLEGASLRWGGCEFKLGMREFHERELMDLRTYEIDVVPHITRRGPNGIWRIFRGPEHPHVKRLTGKTYFVTNEGSLGLSEVTNLDENEYPTVGYAVYLYSTEDAALEAIREDHDGVLTEEMRPVAVTGDDLLQLVSLADVINIGDVETIAQTYKGLVAMGGERIATPDEVVTLLEQGRLPQELDEVGWGLGTYHALSVELVR